MKKRKLLGALFAYLSMWVTAAQAATPASYARIDMGYRWDKVDHRLGFFTENVDTSANPNRASRLGSFQLGGEAQFAVCNWFIKGGSHYGWIPSGNLTEASNFTRKLHGHNIDAYGTLGYLFCFHPCWGLGPVIGYSWDKLVLDSNHYIQVLLNTPPTDQGAIHTYQTYHGPLVGLNALLEPFCHWQVLLEWNIIKGRWRYRDTYANLTRDSLRRHDDVWGNLFHIDAVYTVCSNFSLGLDLKYVTRNNQGTGSYKRTRVPLVFATQRVINVAWQTFTAKFHLDYQF